MGIFSESVDKGLGTVAECDAVLAQLNELTPVIDKFAAGELTGSVAPTSDQWLELYASLRAKVKTINYRANRVGRVPTKHMTSGEERCRLYVEKAREFVLERKFALAGSGLIGSQPQPDTPTGEEPTGQFKYGLFLGDQEVQGHGCTTKEELENYAQNLPGVEIKVVPATAIDLLTEAYVPAEAPEA